MYLHDRGCVLHSAYVQEPCNWKSQYRRIPPPSFRTRRASASIPLKDHSVACLRFSSICLIFHSNSSNSFSSNVSACQSMGSLPLRHLFSLSPTAHTPRCFLAYFLPSSSRRHIFMPAVQSFRHRASSFNVSLANRTRHNGRSSDISCSRNPSSIDTAGAHRSAAAST